MGSGEWTGREIGNLRNGDGGSAIEYWTRNRESPRSNPRLPSFRGLAIFILSSSLSCVINEYLAIDGGGNVSE